MYDGLKKRKILARCAWFGTLGVSKSYHQKKSAADEKGLDMQEVSEISWTSASVNRVNGRGKGRL